MSKAKVFEEQYKKQDGHWIWTGTHAGRPPVPYFRGVPARRWALSESGVDVTQARVFRTCNEKSCVNPSHLRLRSLIESDAVIRCELCGESIQKNDMLKRRFECRSCNNIRWREARNESARRRNRELRRETLAFYGGTCACCGESEEVFLAIDHVLDDGATHRNNMTLSSIYRWLKKEGFPSEGFQILCMNCNWAKAHGGCPHGHPAGQPKSSDMSCV